MKNFPLKSMFYLVLLVFINSCQPKDTKKESSGNNEAFEGSTSSDWNKFENINVDPIEVREAYLMAKNYKAKIDTNNKWGDYVRSDIPSMIAMLKKMDSAGKTHVKMYFGVSTKKDCNGRYVDNLTLFFEGGKAIGDCKESKDCDSCTLNEDHYLEGLKPYNIVHPCPPPPCSGYSRYYIYTKDKEGKLRDNPEVPK